MFRNALQHGGGMRRNSHLLKANHTASVHSPRPRIAGFQQHGVHRRHVRLQPQALLDSGPAYNKYRSRRDIEKDYYQDWERTTLLAQEERDRPMTVFTFLAFLPAWLKFYALPGPLRFAAHLMWRYVLAALHQVHKRLVVQGSQVDVALMRRGGISPAMPSLELALLRLHYRVPVLENIRYRLALLHGKRYAVKPKPWETTTYTPGPESERLPASKYDPTLDPRKAD